MKLLLIRRLRWNLWKLCFNQYWIVEVSLHFNFFNDIKIGVYAPSVLTDGRLIGVIGQTLSWAGLTYYYFFVCGNVTECYLLFSTVVISYDIVVFTIILASTIGYDGL